MLEVVFSGSMGRAGQGKGKGQRHIDEKMILTVPDPVQQLEDTGIDSLLPEGNQVGKNNHDNV